MNKFLLPAMLALNAVSAHAFTNDLRLTSITREGECTTLSWVSHPGEFYTVFWTEDLSGVPFWRVAVVNVPSGGTNTSWSDGSCGQMMMAGGGGANSALASPPKLSEEELARRREEVAARATAGAEYLTKLTREAMERAIQLREQFKAGTLPKSTPTTSAEGASRWRAAAAGRWRF